MTDDPLALAEEVLRLSVRAAVRRRAAEEVAEAATRLLNAIYPAETFIGGSCCEGRTFTCEHDPGVRLVRQLRGALARYDEGVEKP